MAIVCHCELVSDRAVKSAIANGATSIPEITAACSAGGSCAGCSEALDALLMRLERSPRVPRWQRRRLVTQPTA